MVEMQNGKFRGYAETQLHDSFLWLVKADMTFVDESLREYWGTKVLKDSERAQRESTKEFAVLCKLLGRDPSQTYLQSLHNLLQAFHNGDYYFGSFHGFSQADRINVTALIQNAPSKEFPHVEPLEASKKHAKLKKQFGDLEKPFEPEAFLEEHNLRFGRWKKIPAAPPDEQLLDFRTMNVSLMPGRSIRIEINADGSIQQLGPETDGMEQTTDVTFTTSNALLSSEHLVRGHADNFIYEVLYAREDEVDALLDQHQPVFSPLANVSDTANSLLEGLFEQIKDLSMKSALQKLWYLLPPMFSGDHSQSEYEYDLDHLAAYYKSASSFPGTCKAICTVATSLTTSMGLETRIVSGRVLRRDNTGSGHTWPEVALTDGSRKLWMPADCATDAMFAYPKNDQYLVSSYIHHDAFPLKIRVSYFDHD